jgi:hypothetical protein
VSCKSVRMAVAAQIKALNGVNHRLFKPSLDKVFAQQACGDIDMCTQCPSSGGALLVFSSAQS